MTDRVGKRLLHQPSRSVTVRVGKRLLRQFAASRPVKPLLRYLAAIAILGVVLVVVLWLPRAIAEHDIGQPKFRELAADKLGAEVDSVRTTLLQALAGLVLIVGARSAARQLQVTKEGQVTDRYTKAIDQIGNDKSLEVRIGGMYALERIAKDSKPDRITIVEVLAAFVRAHAQRRPSQPRPDGGRAPADVQTALTVLGRIPRPSKAGIDLVGTDLAGVHLGAANLAGANLGSADLDRAILYRADLSAAVLLGATLKGANLSYAKLGDAILIDADLSGADLSSADLTSSFVVRLQRADLTGANLVGVDLRDAQLDEAVFSEPGKETAGTVWPDGFDPIKAGAILKQAHIEHPPPAS